jgi:hypothetical protein
MKTIDLMSITADAISVVTTAISWIRDGDYDDEAVELSNDQYMTLSESMNLVRRLLGNWPDKIRDNLGDDIKDALSNFYLYQYRNSEDDLNTVNIGKVSACASSLHSAIYSEYFKARDAVELYS